MKVAVRVSFRLETTDFASVQAALADTSRRLKDFGDKLMRSTTVMDSIEVRGSELKSDNNLPGDRERERER